MTSPRAFLLLIFLPFLAVEANETFPKPKELEPDIEFWTKVFTEYGNDEGVLHDNRNMAVIYDRVAMPENLGRRERNRRVQKRRVELQATLRSLASGKRDNLTAEEARVLALWPDGVGNETLRAAVGRIRFQQGLRDRFKEGLERSGRWRAHINKELDQFLKLFKCTEWCIEEALQGMVSSSNYTMQS